VTFMTRLTFFPALAIVDHESVGSRPMIDMIHCPGLGFSEASEFQYNNL
jgi:hypothetical protein